MKKRCSIVVFGLIYILVIASAVYWKTDQVEQIEVKKTGLETSEVINIRIIEAEPVAAVTTAEDLVEEKYWDSLELLALVVEAEAGNQSELGKRLVVDVVLNRVDSPDFPDSIEEVITQKNAFTSYWDGGIEKIQCPAPSTYAVVESELNNRTNFEVLFFTSEGYSQYGEDWQKIGDHYFSTGKLTKK